MLNEEKLSNSFWRAIVYIAFYILSSGKLKVNTDKTPYELWYGRQPQSNILKCLEVTVTSKEMRMTLESSTPGLMKEYF